MSFVRVGRPQQHSKGKRPVRPKKAAAPKREWVSTVNDLSVLKATPAELSHRHEIHKSHNKAAAQWELREKALKSRLKHAGSPAPLDKASLSIIREVFSDQLLLQDVLARSDRAMAVVKDLFGDAPRRQTGHPSVTMAPNCDSDSDLPVLQRPDPPTQLSLLSQSMMDQQALNELEASEENHSDEDVYPSASSEYHVVRRANVRKKKARSQGKVIQQKKVHHPISDLENRDGVPLTPCTSGRAPDQTALNATVAVQRVRTRQSQSEEAKEEPSALVSQVLNPDIPLNQTGRVSSRTSRTRKCVSQSSELDGSSLTSLSGDQSSLGLLQAMLGQVEADLDTLSPDTAPESSQSPKQHRTQGLTGFSVALVSTLRRLVHLHRQRDEEIQREAQERKRLEVELREQRGLIDALTAETMTLREAATALQAGLQQRTTELEQKLDAVVLVIGGLGLLEAHTDPPEQSDVKAAVCQSAPVPERRQASVSPAVLLSPPQQRDAWQHIPVTHPVPFHHQLPAVDDLRSWEDIQAQSSASSFTSLPLTSLPSTSSLSLMSDALSSQLPPEAMLAEIAQLSRQNDLIRAQLSQVKSLGSGVGGSLNSDSEQTRPSSSSTGRITPQSVGERRTSGSSSAGRQSQNIQVIDGDKVTHQTTSPKALSVNSAEQRLLELNRQSAAARGRLLELIEQQKQSISSRVSPSVSPIPASALSPPIPAGGGSPEVSMLLPAQELLPQAGGGQRRSAGSEASSHSFGGETRDGKTQMEKQRERQGWFALSAHVR
ncbi:spindle and centriole-associated protein 1 isoform X2 [Toxotes jaculatrix]|uniref:spindle and centriole-associated protein 1 isoform X2 n=1 Tax=Toxotes jaculatrix TaxID=941984 RepID=UPI001B3ACA2D|nr:spindle and centriole-associated protein 1 isoform X2 [Toxotes jaculatrix]